MVGRGNPFPRNYATGNSSESSLFPNPIPEEKGKEFLYLVDNKVVDYLRRITRAYAKNIGGLPIIPALPIINYTSIYFYIKAIKGTNVQRIYKVSVET